MNTPANSGLRFSVNHLLLAMAAISILLALLSNYWIGVNNTVDERIVPFYDAGPVQQAYLVVGLVLVAFLIVAFLVVLAKRRLNLGVLFVVVALAISAFPMWSVFQSKVLEPVRGNEVAAMHNDAASIAALAVEKFCARNKAWPSNWEVLDGDLAEVLNEIRIARNASGTLPNSPIPLPHDDDVAREQSQSILVRLPNHGDLRPEDIRRLVDIEFDCSIDSLLRDDWVKFSGIKPHKPAYNAYRVEFTKLLETLRKIGAAESQIPYGGRASD